MRSDLVSICIPTYNGEKYLKECLDSVLAQSYKSFEIIIVDDCSNDKTIDISSSYLEQDDRIRLYTNEINLGLVENWNKCISLAKGEWIKFVFQDDTISFNCIETMVNTVEEADVLIACKRTFLLDEKASEETVSYYENEVITFEKLNIPAQTVFISPDQISNMGAENICMNFIGEPTSVMFRRSITNELGFFNSNLKQICDLEYFLRIGSNYGVKYIPEKLSQFRIHNSSTTSTNVALNHFILSNLEPIGLVRQLLFDKHFERFRLALKQPNKTKLNRFFSVRVYEAYVNARKFGVSSKEMSSLNSIAEKYSEIKSLQVPSFATQFLYRVVKLRRRLRLLFK